MRIAGRTSTIIICLSAIVIGGGFAILTLPKSKPIAPQTQQDLQRNLPLDKVETALNSLPQTESDTGTRASQSETTCLGRCFNISQRLTDNTVIEDEQFETLLGQMAEFAAYLETHDDARQDMLNLALTTPDGNKRALLIDAFSLLPLAQRDNLGQAFIESHHWRLRTDGVNLLTLDPNITSDKASELITTLETDPHPHVKTTILRGLKSAQTLKGDPTTLDHLSLIMRSETHSSVKSEILLTKLALEEDPLKVMPDTLLALNSGDPDFQYTALIALERMYETDHVTNGNLDQIDHRSIKQGLEALLEIEVTAENKSSMGRLLQEADAFYERHF